MIKAIYDLDMTPRKSLPVIINVSQNDDLGRTLVFNLFSSTGTWTAPDSATATLEGGKPDGKFFSFNCTYSKGTVTAIIQQQMTAVAGKVVCKVKVQSGSKVIESAPIYMMVDAAGIPDGADMSKSDVNDAVATATKKIVEQVAGSIPEDYSALSNSVNELKQDLDAIVSRNRNYYLDKIDIKVGYTITYNNLVEDSGKVLILFPFSVCGVVYDCSDLTNTLLSRLYVTDDYRNRQNGVTSDRIAVMNAPDGFVTIANTDYTKIGFIFDNSKTNYTEEQIREKINIYNLKPVEDLINDGYYERPYVQERTDNLIDNKCILNGIKCTSRGSLTFEREDEYITVICPVNEGDTITSNLGSVALDGFSVDENLSLKLTGANFGINESATGSKYRYTTINANGYAILSFKASDFCLTNSESTDINDLWIATSNLDELYDNGGTKYKVPTNAIQGEYRNAYILPEHTTSYYRGKKIAYIGDSTGASNTSGGCGEYRKYVNTALGLVEATWSSTVDMGYNDFSQGGSRMECESESNQYDSAGTALESNGRFSACGDARVNTLPSDCDIICIFMGVNASDQAMEKDTDTSLWTLENSDVTTFIGAYNVCISKIMYHYGMSAYYSNIDYSNVTVVGDGTKVPQIIVMAPVHSGETLSDKMDTYQDKLQGHIMWRRKALEYMSNLWGTPYLDTQRCMMANPFTVPLYYRYVNDTQGYDKIHFNLRGAKQVADGLIGLLRSVEPIAENINMI